MAAIYRSAVSLFCVLLSMNAWSDNTNTVNYDGTLVNLACVIDEGSAVEVDMGSIVDNTLYIYGHSVAKNFSLVLKNCDPVLANTVKITLKAPAGSVTTEGDLSFDSSSTAKGAVIGISDNNLTPQRIPIGSSLPKKSIEKGTMRIPLYASIFATPEALKNKSIVLGHFTATLYYEVEFE